MSWNDKVGAVEAAEELGKKAGLPQVLEQQLEDEDDNREIVHLMEKGLALKASIAQLQQEDKEIREKLGEIAAVNGLEGFRHNDIVYTQRLQPGRVTVSMEKVKEGLVARRVPIALIDECVHAATKQGEGFWVREISVLKPARKK